jgi:hypothetical protein
MVSIASVASVVSMTSMISVSTSRARRPSGPQRCLPPRRPKSITTGSSVKRVWKGAPLILPSKFGDVTDVSADYILCWEMKACRFD